MLCHQIAQADNRGVDRTGSNQAERPRNLNCEGVLHFLLVRNTEQGKCGRSRLSFPFGFNGSQFGFLHVPHFVTGFITQYDNGKDSSHTEAGSNGERTLGKSNVTPFQQIVRADTQHEHRAGGVASSYGVNELHLCNRVEDQLGEAEHLHTHGFKVEVGGDWVLHPAVGDQDPQRRQV
ncbi:hypothetical protein D3C73_917290 [compost metagenome]